MPKPCLIDGCTKPAGIPGTARGWCVKHYGNFKRTGDPLYGINDLRDRVTGAPCSVDDCKNVSVSQKLCPRHLRRWKLYGDPLGSKRGTDESRFLARLGEPTETGCREWTGGRFRTGYGRFNAGGFDWVATRWAYTHFVGPIPEGLDILHSCDNPPCCELGHLRPGTAHDNKQDELGRGRSNPPRGTRNPRAVLNEEAVRAIRRLYVPRQFGARKIARLLGLNEGTVRAIVNGPNWRHIV